MKIRILDRITTAVAGLILLAGCVLLAGSVFFGKTWADTALNMVKENHVLALAAILFLLAVMLLCFLILFRHIPRKNRYLVQKSEAGECHIALKALDEQVTKCLMEHPELEVGEVKLQNIKNRLCIHISGNIAGGISIPMTVESIQNEIRDYLQKCSGVTVKDIRFSVEETGADAANAPYILHPVKNQEETAVKPADSAPAEGEMPLIPEAEEKQAPQEVKAAAPAVTEDDTDDGRPLHQRIFSAPPEVCLVPCPPETEEDTEESGQTEEIAAETEETDEMTEGTGSQSDPDDRPLGFFDEEGATLADPVTRIPFAGRGEEIGEER